MLACAQVEFPAHGSNTIVHEKTIASFALTVNIRKQLFLPKRSLHNLPANQAATA